MPESDEERILCLPRGDLPYEWVTDIACEPLPWNAFRVTMNFATAVWLPRSEAENDDSFKQLIPYLVVERSGYGEIACYRRKGSEDRLHGLWSVGIGGHVNTLDRSGRNGSGHEAVLSCLERETFEELGLPSVGSRALFVGLINEEVTEVGTVHLGLVFKISLGNGESLDPGEELHDFRWMSLHSVSELDLELWSRLALQLLIGDGS